MAKKKAKVETYTATFEGRQFQVPKGLMGADLCAYIDTTLELEAAEAARNEAAKAAEVSELQATQLRLHQMEAQMAEQAAALERLKEENQQLQRASPESAAATMGLLHAASKAQDLRMQLHQDMGTIAEWRSRFGEDISDVAAEVRRKNAKLDAEVEERRKKTRAFMNDLRQQQGLDPTPYED